MASIEDQKSALEKKRDAINARLQKLKNRERSAERKLDTRRKILLGAFLLERLRKEHPQLVSIVQSELPGFLTKDADKELLSEFLRAPRPAVEAGGGTMPSPLGE